jgi:hypothetical protein
MLPMEIIRPFCQCLIAIPFLLVGCNQEKTNLPKSTTAPVAAPASSPSTVSSPPVVATPAVPTPPPGIPGDIISTPAETAYRDTYAKIFQLIDQAESRIRSRRGDLKTNISLSKADIDTAWELQLRNTNVPLRFVAANQYLTEGLRLEQDALLRLQLGADGGTAAEDSYAAAGELFKKSYAEFKKQVEQMRLK